MYSPRLSRRGFFRESAQAAAPAAVSGLPLIVPSSVRGALAPSNRITVACIGTGNQGYDVMRHFLNMSDAQVVAVCDVNRGSYGYRDEKQFRGREPAQKAVNEYYAKKLGSGRYASCAAYHDFRDVLARNDVDAVTVVVPDHWHALMTIAAAETGKDIYCEKPLSLTIRDGQAMIGAVRRHKRILQTGSHERSNPVTRHACELVRNGRIGRLKKITTFVGFNNKVGPGPGWHEMPVPDGFDYATWLGPAPLAPYHNDRCLYRFRFNYDYSGGQVTNFGAAHSNDMVQWAMGTDDTGPTEVELRTATFLPKGSLFTTATETRFRCRYANGVELVCESEKSQVGGPLRGHRRHDPGWLRRPVHDARVAQDVGDRPQGSPPLPQRRPRSQFPRLREEPGRAGLARGSGPPQRERLPSGKHRHPPGQEATHGLGPSP